VRQLQNYSGNVWAIPAFVYRHLYYQIPKREQTMDRVVSGMIAGLTATVVLSMIMIAKGMMGLMPELNVIAMLGSMTNTTLTMGWIIHFMIGMLAWGASFAFFFNVLPGGSILGKSISFSIAAWILMMTVVMPMADGGLFGSSLGIMVPVTTLMLHVIYGAVFGRVFGRLGVAKTDIAVPAPNTA
jgi:hypothetical protein